MSHSAAGLHLPASHAQLATLLSNVQTRSLCTHRTRPAREWARSKNHAKSSVIIVFPPPRGYIAGLHLPASHAQLATLLSNVQTRSLCTHRTRPAREWARSKNHAKSSVIIVFPPPRGYIATMRARGRPNTRGMDRDGHRGFETSMRPRVAHGVRRSGAPRRSRSQQPALEATPPPAPIHGGDRDSTRFDQSFRQKR